jgi:hypothetical protein
MILTRWIDVDPGNDVRRSPRPVTFPDPAVVAPPPSNCRHQCARMWHILMSDELILCLDGVGIAVRDLFHRAS